MKINEIIEGYWYSEYTPQYPMPIRDQLTDEQAKEIYDLIIEKEKLSKEVFCKGSSHSRIDGTIVGSSTYYFRLNDYNYRVWPNGFAEHYVLKYKVKPTDDFLKFIGYTSVV